jgi:GntR family transcriptional repressor for pyruvate dehydrogenase complex
MLKAFNGGKPAPKRKLAYEEVAGAIREQVLAGNLKEGNRLPPERDLAHVFGVSRVVVREAIRTLETSGLLRIQKGAGGGTFVSTNFDKPLTTSLANFLDGGTITLEHLFEIRLLLEPPAAELAAKRVTAKGQASLEEILQQAEDVWDDPDALRTANLEFHRRLVALAGNPLLSAFCEKVIQILVGSLQDKLSIATSQAVVPHHRKILKAIQKGRPEEAKKRTEGDLKVLLQRYQQLGINLRQWSGKAGRRKINRSRRP